MIPLAQRVDELAQRVANLERALHMHGLHFALCAQCGAVMRDSRLIGDRRVWLSGCNLDGIMLRPTTASPSTYSCHACTVALAQNAQDPVTVYTLAHYVLRYGDRLTQASKQAPFALIAANPLVAEAIQVLRDESAAHDETP